MQAVCAGWDGRTEYGNGGREQEMGVDVAVDQSRHINKHT